MLKSYSTQTSGYTPGQDIQIFVKYSTKLITCNFILSYFLKESILQKSQVIFKPTFFL